MFLARHIGAASPGPGDDFWYMPVGTGGRRPVSALSAMQLSTVYKCVRAIAESLAMLPWHLYRRLPRGKERQPDHPVARLLRNPNPWQTAMQWREMMAGHAVLRGRAFSRIVYDGLGDPVALIPLHPDRMKVEVLPTGLPRYRYTPPGGGAEQVLVFGEVLHLTGLCADGYDGLNPIEQQRLSIGAAITTRDYGDRYFSNSAKSPTWVEFPGKFGSDEARRQYVRQWAEMYGGVNAGRTPVLEQGMKLHELKVSNTDSQFLEIRKYQDVDICGIFRVPPHKVGILDRATWSNIEHQGLEWVTDGLMPWAVRFEQCLHRDLMLGDELLVEVLLDALLRGDTKSRYEAYGKGIQDGWLTRNEARERENLNPIDGLDEPLEPLNMAPAGSRGADHARGNAPAAAQAGQGDDRAAQFEQRRLAVMQAAAERVARKEVALLQRAVRTGGDVVATWLELTAGHAEFVVEVMGVSAAAAAQHCAATTDRISQHHADGALARMQAQDFIDRQTAALLRLED